MLIGYARVSTLDQTLALQQDALSAAGCHEIYTDTVSGSVTERPGLTDALRFSHQQWRSASGGDVRALVAGAAGM